jgi:hypothetical protein
VEIRMMLFRYLSLVPFLIIAACGDNAAPPGGGSSSGGSSSSSSGNVPQDSGADVIPAASISLAIADATVIQGSTVELTLELTRGASVTGDVGVKFATLPLGLGLPVGDLVFKAGQSTLKVQLSAGIDGKQGDAKLSATATTLDGATSSKKDFTVLVRGAPGTLDKTFGVDGVVMLPTGLGLARQLVVDSQDRPIFVHTSNDGEDLLRVRRFTPAGAADTTFGSAGVVSNAELAGGQSSLVLQPDDSAYVVSRGPVQTVNVRKVSATGVLDATPLFTSTVSSAISVTKGFPLAGGSGGFVLGYGSSNPGFGRVDFFSKGGTLLGSQANTNRLQRAVAASDGTYYVASFDGTLPFLAHYGTAGNVIDAFSGTVVSGYPFANCGALLPRKVGGTFALCDASLSSSFGTGPVVVLALGPDMTYDLAFGTDGKLQIGSRAGVSMIDDGAGAVLANDLTGIVRFSVTGKLDTTFGNGGRAVPAEGHSAFQLARRKSGRILALTVTSIDGYALEQFWP